MEKLVADVRGQLARHTGVPEEQIFFDSGRFGDFSSMLPIRLAKAKGADPQQMAVGLAEKIKVSGVEARGEQGFLNFYLTDKALVHNLEHLEDFGQKGTMVIDYSSPNIAKPFSVGHLRSTIIGESLRRIFTLLGWKVHGINFIGDWGTQFGKLITAYQIWGKGEVNGIKDMFDLYVKFHVAAETEPKLEELAREWFRKLEEGDEEAVSIWDKFREKSLEEFQKFYHKLDISHLEDGSESKFVKKAVELVDDLWQREVAEEDQGAIVIKTSTDVPLLLRKQDGTTIYAARDLASAIWRTQQFRPDLLLYVVGNDQKLHFKLLFEGLKKCGINTPAEHINFGMVSLPEGKMSTRKGRVVFLEDVLEEAWHRVGEVMGNREGVSEEDRWKLAIGAVKFADLKTHRTRDVIFTWDMVRMEGETGPYVQYATVRAKRIAEKFGKGKVNEKEWGDEERKLARQLVNFRMNLLDAAAQRRPDLIAKWLLVTTKTFNDYYERCRMEGSEHRVWLANRVAEALSRGLNLMGIDVPARM